MTNDEIRIAIAEICGWVYKPGDEPTYGGTYKQAIWYHPNHGGHKTDWISKTVFGLPNYPSDLNAMHEAEKQLNDEDAKTYAWELCKVIGMGVTWLPRGPIHVYIMLHATALQRAEAFLRVFGKWKE